MWTYSGNVGGYYGGYTSEPPVIHRDYRFETPMDLGNYASLTSTIPWQTWSTVDLPNMTSDKEEGPEVKIHDVNTGDPNTVAAVCSNPVDLSVEKVLTTLSGVKGKLMLTLAVRPALSMECLISPAVKDNIIKASKKLKMYGKPMPIIPRFDEWGNRLPDDIRIGDSAGITLKIVDPEDYDEHYLELRATTADMRWSIDEDLPF